MVLEHSIARCNGTYNHLQESINVQSRQILKSMQT